MTTDLERTTVRRYLLATVFQGIWTSGQYLFPFVLAKSLHAPAWLVTAVVVMETSGMMLGLYWGQLMAGGGRRRWLFWAGLGGRVVLAAAAMVQTAGQFTLVLVPVYFFGAIVYPAQNSILQENIAPERRGEIFGRGALVQHLTAACTGLAVGAVLNRDADLFRWVYPVLGILGFGFPLLLSRLPRPVVPGAREPDRVFVVPRLPLGPVQWRRLAGALVAPFREARETFRRDRAFLWYEMNFQIYGIAYMMLIPTVPLFFANELQLSYQTISSARVFIGSLGIALLGPAAGRLMDRIHPARLCAISFGWVVLYPVSLAVGAQAAFMSPETAAYLAFAVYGVGMAGVNVTWNVGSIAFAPTGRGGHYQGIHVTMVGIRGVLGPLLGFTVLRFMGYQEVFIVAACFFLAASASSWLLARHHTRA